MEAVKKVSLEKEAEGPIWDSVEEADSADPRRARSVDNVLRLVHVADSTQREVSGTVSGYTPQLVFHVRVGVAQGKSVQGVVAK